MYIDFSPVKGKSDPASLWATRWSREKHASWNWSDKESWAPHFKYLTACMNLSPEAALDVMGAPPAIRRVHERPPASTSNRWIEATYDLSVPLPGSPDGRKHRAKRTKAMERAFLSRDEERALLQRWLNHGDVAARNEIVLAFLPLVKRIVKLCTLGAPRKHAPIKFKGGWITRDARATPFEDLELEGVLGLVRALKTFDPGRGLRFGTYARHWVRAYIQICLNKSRDYRLVFESDALQVREDDDGNSVSISVFDKCAYDSWVTKSSEIYRQESQGKLSTIVETLSDERQRKIFIARKLSDDPPTLNMLAGRLGITPERARQIEARAFAKVRSALTERASV